jgi:hypothetical protein
MAEGGSSNRSCLSWPLTKKAILAQLTHGAGLQSELSITAYHRHGNSLEAFCYRPRAVADQPSH